jgi:hypothetical protein
MSYKIEILDQEEYLTSDLYVRPLNDYVGMFHRPDNYYSWKPIGEVLGEYWFESGKRQLKELTNGDGPPLYYEFMRKL